MRGWPQDMDKHDAVADKRRESIMTDLSSARSQLTGTEQEASRLQTEKEKAQFELHAKKGEAAAAAQRVHCLDQR